MAGLGGLKNQLDMDLASAKLEVERATKEAEEAAKAASEAEKVLMEYLAALQELAELRAMAKNKERISAFS